MPGAGRGAARAIVPAAFLPRPMRLAPLLVLLAAAPVFAQPLPGTCRLGVDEDSLTAGDVRAVVFNTGSLFFGNTTTAGDGYIVPKGTGRSPVFAAGLWIGGTVRGELRLAAATYAGYNFWSGPLGADARPADPSDCSPYDRIYTVSRGDISDYYATGRAADDLRDWPWRLGAPVLDGDGIADNYSLAGGDQPAIRGDQTAWWLMNDVGGPHAINATPPLGVEVRVEAFALARRPLAQTTFYRYTFTNRTAEAVDSVYVSLFVDPDLGSSVDEYTGTDTTNGMGYTYNADNADAVYGIPPAIGFQVVEAPVRYASGRDADEAAGEAGERLGMTSSMLFFSTAGPSGDPATGIGRYFFMKGRYADGSVMRESGNGYEQTHGNVTTFMFAGDPVTNRAWNEPNPGVGLPPIQPGDHRILVSTGPFRLGPGQSETVTFAVPFAQGTSNLNSVTRLRGLAAAVRAVTRAGAFEPVAVERPDDGAPTDLVRLSAPSPSPFTVRTVVRYEAPAGTLLRATLHDVLGRRVAVVHDGPTTTTAGEIAVDGRGLAPGTYLLRVRVPAGERVVTLVRTR